MPGREIDALVIGAGVSGLSTAVQLAEAGLRVQVWTADTPEATTSMAAGAMWGPYLVEPASKVGTWSRRTLDELRRLATTPETGIRLIPGIEASRTLVPPPEWGDQLDGFRMCLPEELPPGFAAGWRYVAPLVDMPVYLGYLTHRLSALGATVEVRRVQNLGEAAEEASVVVNCTGIGARELVPDPEVTAIRGQLVVVENPGLTEFFAEDTGPVPNLLNIYPHGETVTLGGLAAPDDYRLSPDPSVADAIVERCVAVEPRLGSVRILDHRVGLRPTRPEVRVEAERVNGTTVIHNYGHGGAGVTLSWGCASEVVTLAKAATSRK